MSRVRNAALALAVAALAALVFFASPVLQITDSAYTMLLSEHLLLEHSFALDPDFPPAVSSAGYPEVSRAQPIPRHLRRVDGRWYHFFPHGSAVLTVPIVAALRPLGISSIAADGRYDPDGAARIHKVAAALICGAACGVFFLIARLLLGPLTSALVALGAGLGTQVWSTASRAVGSQTWTQLLLGVALLLLLRASLGRGRLRPVALGTALSLAFFVRPTAVLAILPITAVVVWKHRREALWMIGTGALWLGLFVAYSATCFGTLLPEYYRRGSRLATETLGLGLASNLWAPSRGLLVYVPAWIAVALLLVLGRRELRCRELVAAGATASVLLVVVASGYDNWWAGASYGARFTTDLVPWLVLFATLALDSVRGARGRVAGVALLAVAATVGAVLNGAGAVSPAGMRWNAEPVPLRQDPERVFDWSRPQFAAALSGRRAG